MYSSIPTKKNTIKAYRFINKAVQLGVTHFEAMDKFFKGNFDVLKAEFAKIRAPPEGLNGRQEIENLHDAYL